MIQEQSLPEPRKLENLMLCNTRSCTPTYLDRNFCFRVSNTQNGGGGGVRGSIERVSRDVLLMRLVMMIMLWLLEGEGGGGH